MVNIPPFTGFHTCWVVGRISSMNSCQIPSYHKCSKTNVGTLQDHGKHALHRAWKAGKPWLEPQPQWCNGSMIHGTWFATFNSSMDPSISFSACNFRRFYAQYDNMMGQTNRWFCFIPRIWKFSKAVFVSDNKRIPSVSCPPWIQAEAESFERFLYTCPVCTGKDCNTNMYKYSSNTYPYTRRYTHTHLSIALHCITLHCLHHITLHTYIHEEYSQQECPYRSTCSFHWKSLNYIKSYIVIYNIGKCINMLHVESVSLTTAQHVHRWYSNTVSVSRSAIHHLVLGDVANLRRIAPGETKFR